MIKSTRKLPFLLVLGFILVLYYLWGKLSAQDTAEDLLRPNAQRLFYIGNKSASKERNISSASAAEDYCNFPGNLDALTLQEGKGKPGWKLKQVQVVIRHGDRTPLKYDFYNTRGFFPNFCNIFNDEYVGKQNLLVKYRNAMSKQYASAMESSPSLISSLFANPMPRAIICSPGQLTNLGVLQHLHNGFMLREIYVHKHKLLDLKMAPESVKATSTRLRRTFQSAVAFLFGLLPNFNLFKVPIGRANNVVFCENKCNCPFARGKSVKSGIYAKQNYIYNERQKKNPTVLKLASLPTIGDHTGAQIDALVTGYLCKGMKLPCNSTACVTEDDLNVILNEQEYMNRVLVEESPLRNQSMLQAQPMLERIASDMQEKIKGTSDSLQIVLYSGHDSTIRSLLVGLGIPDYRWPRLGSRLVFELWEGEGGHFIKIIFNGADVTNETFYCSDLTAHGGCSYRMFQNYVVHGIPEYFGFKTVANACSAT